MACAWAAAAATSSGNSASALSSPAALASAAITFLSMTTLLSAMMRRGGGAGKNRSHQPGGEVDAERQDGRVEEEAQQPVQGRQPAHLARRDLHVGDLERH